MPEYLTPASLEEALNLLACHAGQARIIAGGTDLMIDLSKGKKQAVVLVDITRIAGMDTIRVEAGMVEIGAGVTFTQLKQHPWLKQRVPMLTEAAAAVGAAGIQTTATLVGNLVQAMPAADGAVAALALEAEVQVAGAGRLAWQPVSTLFAGPGKSTIDSSRQIITHLRFKIPAASWGTAWQRLGRRPALTLPILNCAVSLELGDGLIRNARIALGPVASTPFRARAAESFLAGKPPDLETFAEAGRIAQSESDPRGNPLRASRAYRLEVIPVLIRRALTDAALRARQSVTI